MSDQKKVRLDHLLGVYAVGSGDWPWTEEYDRLIDQPGTQKLLARIRDEGIREPILLGTDGRVWDGHHRIVIAMHLGLDSVPVEFAGVVAEEPEWEWGSEGKEGTSDPDPRPLEDDRLFWPTHLTGVRELTREQAESVIAAWNEGDPESSFLIRRRKAGPWVPVEQGDAS